jgi:hydrophobic/amphiphilic exporter-1 (mainly G- bacteria), HAE1 family
MNIAEISVRRPVFAIMMTAALIVLGAVSYESLGLDLMPKTDAPVVSVQANLPGASAEEIETTITKRIEEAVNTISGIDELRASSDQGNSRVTINFTLERDIESATQDVRDKLAQIVNQFPRDTRPLQITKMDPDAQPIFGFAVFGPRAGKELTEIAEKRVKQELETVKDVGSVGYNGERKREIQLLLNADRLNAYGLTVDQVRTAVERQNVEIPGGQFTAGPADVAVRTMGRIKNVADFNRIVISYRADGSVITFADVGRVQDTTQEVRSATRLSGTPAIGVQVRKQSGTNTVEVVDRVQERLQRIQTQLPQHRQRSVALHPALVRGHQAAPDSRRPARQRRRVPVHPEHPRHLHRRPGHPDIDHRHLHVHEDRRFHPQQHDHAGAFAGDRHRHRRRDRRAGEHLPVRRREGRNAEGSGR